MKSLFILICSFLLVVFHSNAQLAKIISKGIEYFFEPAGKKVLLKEIEHFSLKPILPKTEREVYDFFQSNSLVLKEKNAIRFSEVVGFRNSTYGYGDKYRGHAKSDIIVFKSPEEKESFLYLNDRDLIDISSADPITAFATTKNFLGSRYAVSNFNVNNQKFVNAANDALARNVLTSHKFAADRNGDLAYSIMVFQKTCEIPISGQLDKKTIEKLKNLTYKGQVEARLEELHMSGVVFKNPEAAKYADWGYTGSTVAKMMADKRLQGNYLSGYFTLGSNKKVVDELAKQLEFLSRQGFIPSKKGNWTSIVVEKGIFKFQKKNGLKLTGEFDQETWSALKREKEIQDDIFSINADETFSYRNKTYNKFEEIPFKNSDYLSFKKPLSEDEAGHLMRRGVKFIYNKPAFLKQKDKPFEIIYLVSEDPDIVKELYELDEIHAKKLIELSADLIHNKMVTKVSSFDQMIARQNEVISKKKVPILVFHNNIDKDKLKLFNPECNFITCNSFQVSSDAYLASTDFLDMQAIADGIGAGYQNKTLQGFYADFTNSYYNAMAQKNQQNTLLYLGGAAVMGAGIYTIVYYNSNK